ncbi:MAG: phosphoglycerate kinase [Candidatus Heimdallarchaeota archaeon]|nr:phosphoglycerate kinase [Candidatus Heimdallarchaeota archaeon]MCK5047915.1 phosphoglycerate kinase [Candidatus Heimdallarchaeota archaeon]
MTDYWTLDDFDFEGKVVLCRVDFNSPLDNELKVVGDARIRLHSETIEELASKGAKVVILAHQGRPGSSDFSLLNEHSLILEKHTGKNVELVDDIIGLHAREKIKKLENGQILVLQNVRLLSEEILEKTPERLANTFFVKNLAPLADYFVNDAFAAAHRGHTSLVGFAEKLTAVAGRVMEREINGLSKTLFPDPPTSLVVGGTKPDASIDIIVNMLSNKKVDHILSGGILAPMLLEVAGYKIGEGNITAINLFGGLSLIKDLSEMYNFNKEAFILPTDAVVLTPTSDPSDEVIEIISVEDIKSDQLIYDIGPETTANYAEYIKKSKTIICNGPMGVFEKKEFRNGTLGVFQAIADSQGFSVLGGGHTLKVLDFMDYADGDFSLISTGGGAMTEFLMGKQLPAIEALYNSYKRKNS